MLRYLFMLFGLSVGLHANEQIIAKGKALYNGANGCFACHQINGKGLQNIIPSLEKSPWVSGNSERLITMALKGLEGQILVNGKPYTGSMPPQSLFNDEQIAAILTYTRNAFGNKASVITEEEVSAIRKNLKGGSSAKELLKQFPFKKRDAKKNGLSKSTSFDTPLYTDKPTIVRTFMPGSSPAAFAVALPEGQYYCWDAGECRLRYVWQKGGFITGLKKHWSSNKRAAPSFNGQIYYLARNSQITLKDIQNKNQTNHKKPIYDTTQAKDFPILISGKLLTPQYKGYKLIDNYPEFWYKAGEYDIREMITATSDKKGIVRVFKIDSKSQAVTIKLNSQKTATISASSGKLANGELSLTAEEAKEVRITIKEVN